jgi:hypothetical protein
MLQCMYDHTVMIWQIVQCVRHMCQVYRASPES